MLVESLNKPWFIYFCLPVILLAGTCFTLFLSEQITNKGVGNGTSLIIFSGIAAALPSKFKNAWNIYVSANTDSALFIGIMNMFAYVFLFGVIIAAITFIYLSERHIPIQQTGSSMSKDIKQMSRLPIKVNTAGVIPIMFASIVIVIPLQIAQLLNPLSQVRF
jgi:preprotein translocase subunit SecY